MSDSLQYERLLIFRVEALVHNRCLEIILKLKGKMGRGGRSVIFSSKTFSMYLFMPGDQEQLDVRV